MTCQCLSDDVRERIHRAFQLSVISSIGAIVVGSFLSLLSVIIQVWIQSGAAPDIADSLGILGVLRNVGSYLLLQSTLVGFIMLPFALAVGVPVIFLFLREHMVTRRILYGVLGCLIALIIATVIVSYPTFMPVNYFMPVIYGACFTTAIVLFEKYF